MMSHIFFFVYRHKRKNFFEDSQGSREANDEDEDDGRTAAGGRRPLKRRCYDDETQPGEGRPHSASTAWPMINASDENSPPPKGPRLGSDGEGIANESYLHTNLMLHRLHREREEREQRRGSGGHNTS